MKPTDRDGRGAPAADQLTGMKLGAPDDALCPDRANDETAEEDDDAQAIDREGDGAPGNVRRWRRRPSA
jgi:hypothetical protein